MIWTSVIVCKIAIPIRNNQIHWNIIISLEITYISFSIFSEFFLKSGFPKVICGDLYQILITFVFSYSHNIFRMSNCFFRTVRADL